jgi:hypothetical protein
MSACPSGAANILSAWGKKVNVTGPNIAKAIRYHSHSRVIDFLSLGLDYTPKAREFLSDLCANIRNPVIGRSKYWNLDYDQREEVIIRVVTAHALAWIEEMEKP